LARGLDVAVTHPRLQRAHRHTGRHSRSEGVTEVVKAMHYVKMYGAERLSVPAEDRCLVERTHRQRVGEHQLVVARVLGRVVEPVELARYGVRHRHAARRAFALGRPELVEHVVLPDSDARRPPVDVAPAQRDQLALAEPGHRCRNVERSIDGVVRALRGVVGERQDLVGLEEADVFAALRRRQLYPVSDVLRDPALALREAE
jgi:hypothetical protein